MNSKLTASLQIFAAGLLVPLAVALNARVGQALKSPLLGAAAVPVVGLAFIGLVLALTRTPLPDWRALTEVPPYAWLGGALVTLYFIILIFNAPKVGLGFAVSLVVAGQLAISAVIDHFGLLGIAEAPFSWGRLAGALLIVSGVACLKFF